MPPNLRLSLTIFSVGFAVEGTLDAYHAVSGSSRLLSGGLLFLVATVATLLGLLFLWVGRFEWSELHQRHARRIRGSFVVTLALAAAAAVPVAYFLAGRGGTPPSWLDRGTAATVAGTLFFSFLTYALVPYHLVAGVGKATLWAAVLASVPVAVLVGQSVTQNFGSTLQNVPVGAMSAAGFVDPLLRLLSWLFVSYFLLLLAFLDAHRRVVRGLVPAGVLAPSVA